VNTLNLLSEGKSSAINSSEIKSASTTGLQGAGGINTFESTSTDGTGALAEVRARVGFEGDHGTTRTGASRGGRGEDTGVVDTVTSGVVAVRLSERSDDVLSGSSAESIGTTTSSVSSTEVEAISVTGALGSNVGTPSFRRASSTSGADSGSSANNGLTSVGDGVAGVGVADLRTSTGSTTEAELTSL